MSTVPTVSNEQIHISHTSLLGVELLGLIETIQRTAQAEGGLVRSDGEKITALITKHTHLNIRPHIVPNSTILSINTEDPVGHSGVTGDLKKYGILSGKYTSFENRLLRGTIDLKKVQVGGEFREIEMCLTLGEERFKDTHLTAEELTAGLLHEIGHAFWSLAAIGDYVWLNYFLTDGIEVLLGKKPNQYRTEILDIGYLEKHVSDPTLRHQLREQPSEANLRRAILDVKYNRMRGHLHSVTDPGSWKRHEQMADWFAARMGFARPLASMIHKVERQPVSNRRYYSTSMVVGVEVAKVLLGINALINPVGMGMVMFSLVAIGLLEASSRDKTPTYDNPTERIRKIRHELVAQLKELGHDRATAQRLQEDIDTVDNMLATMNTHRTILETVTHAVFPTARRSHDQLKQEQQLEALLNNDLFVHAQKFR